MKRTIFIALLLALFAIPGITQNNCGLFITTSFDSECILTDYDRPSKPLIDESICFHACRDSYVYYYAEGMNNATYEWNVQGEENWNIIDETTIRVKWPDDGDVGNVICTATSEVGQVCTFNRCIELIEKPIAGISTIPEADMTGEIPVLDVCLGQTVTFSDNSIFSNNTPLTGYFWEWDNASYEDVTTENFDFTFNQVGEFELKHEVVNECGCSDIKKMVIRVNEKPSLELDCYGTACGNAEVTYRINNTECTDYIWEVQGGTLVDFNYPELTIQWENPASGYGLIRLDGAYCDGICDDNTYVKIPLLTNNTEIQGPETVCIDEASLFELPLWGATQYDWDFSGSPGNDYVLYNSLTPNQLLVSFNNPGVYTLNANYTNDVLPDCGNYQAEIFTITVKDNFEIDAPVNGCPGEQLEFTTDPQIDADWVIYDEQDNQIYSENSSQILNYQFADPGNYLVTAYNDNYCQIEQDNITIYEGPEQPEITAINGPHTACPNTAEMYTASASDTMYYVGWQSNYTTPSSFDGEEFTANFGPTVGNVGVYHVDRITGCKSQVTW